VLGVTEIIVIYGSSITIEPSYLNVIDFVNASVSSAATVTIIIVL
jgi:hypothetical protein